MAPLNINDNEAYKRYKDLTDRPLGMFPLAKDDDNRYIVAAGELFCRKDVMSADEALEAQAEGTDNFRLCDQKSRFSTTGNLRAHLKLSHKLLLAEVRKGTNSAEHVRQNARFFERTMRNHDHHVAALASGQPVDQFMDTPEPPTPVKDKPIARQAPRRPDVPLKKDNTPNKSRMRALSTVTHKCQKCRALKRKVCPPDNRLPCDVWDYFTEDEDEESDDEEEERVDEEEESDDEDE
ncbi:hypothetical protein V490_09299 [Pseudogymnoascus sp. VKM F-3557]|nr:hypothetical protein V490_09299 [Pseudogymnoascus sp. VKM F-3557]